MKTNLVILAVITSWTGVLLGWGCVKGGPLLPYDLPLPTPTPVSGAIEAGVVDNGSPVAGVTVFAVDPNGDTLTAVTDTFGKVAYNPNPLLVGIWWMKVPTQGRYFLSTEPMTVTGGGSYSVTFTAGGQTLQVTPTTAETYGSSNTPIGYFITYNQPGNLSVPVSLSTSNDLPGPWGKVFQSNILGAGVNSSNVTITKTGCYVSTFGYFFNSLDFSGAYVDSYPTTISRGYAIPLLLNASGTLTNSTCRTTGNFSANLSVTGDCNQAYPLQVVGFQGTGPSTFLNQTVSITNGVPQAFTFSNNNNNPLTIRFTLTGPASVYSAAISFNQGCSAVTTLNVDLVNTSY